MTVPIKVRTSVLTRCEGQCERCGGPLGSDYSVHHRKLRSQGGKDTADNLAVICGSGTTGCHLLVHSERLEIGEPEGYIVPGWADPAGMPVTHHYHGTVYLLPDGTYSVELAA